LKRFRNSNKARNNILVFFYVTPKVEKTLKIWYNISVYYIYHEVYIKLQLMQRDFGAFSAAFPVFSEFMIIEIYKF